MLDREPDGSFERNRLILSGHSQGSLIVLSTVSRLDEDQLPRTRVITYGSQIRALYGRIFPRVFGADVVGYRATSGTATLDEPAPDLPAPSTGRRSPAPGTGGLGATAGSPMPAASGSTCSVVPIPWAGASSPTSTASSTGRCREVPPEGVGDPGPQVMGHSGYQHTAVYRRQIHDWTGEPFVARPHRHPRPDDPAADLGPSVRRATAKTRRKGSTTAPSRSG